ncbi:MAG: biotin--[Firmicutes bacterium]|nr:biotin--[acetyl-CoA-carboxylase] ligase [Bacillota bacterium]
MKYDIINIMREKNDFISGEELAEKFGVSRVSVWKNICKLKEEGYIIDSVTNRGYLLKGCFDVLNENEAKRNLRTAYIGQKCIYKNETDSTNDDAKNLASSSFTENNGTVIIAESQKKGKGRLGRKWEAEKKGLYFSVILRPDIMPQEAPQITLLAGIAVAKAIERICGLAAKIKWPNDVIAEGRKISGILTEMSAEMERVKYIVVGIGINVNNVEFPEEINNKAASVYTLTGKKNDRTEIYKAVLEEFEILYDEYIKQGGFSFAAKEYSKMCVTIGMKVKISLKDKEITGEAIGIDNNGALMIKK